MVRILDLFAGTQSVRKALTEKYEITDWIFINETNVWEGYIGDNDTHSIEYIGIDIISPEYDNLIMDLTGRNIVQKLQHKLPYGWKPDFIWASPICNKFSMATTGANGNTYFIVDKETNTIRPRLPHEYIDVKHNKYNLKPENWDKYHSESLLALTMHENTKRIIDHFNVPFAIENPQRSLVKYIYKDYIKNVAEYCAYGFEYKKATAIYAKQSLNLKRHDSKETQRHLLFAYLNKTDKWPEHWDRNVSMYANRSSVPPLLIQEIIKELLNDR